MVAAATPLAGDVRAGYPAYLHTGTWADHVAEPSHQLGAATLWVGRGVTLEEIGEGRGAGTAVPVLTTETTLGVPFDDLLDGDPPP